LSIASLIGGSDYGRLVDLKKCSPRVRVGDAAGAFEHTF